jgi:2'-5' RNA ligase
VAATAIIVPVGQVDQAVFAWRRRCTADGAAGMPPHVTLLYPFADDEVVGPDQIGELRAALGEFEPFSVSFGSFGRFAGSPPVLYLEPDPAQPFNEMTASIVDAFPDFPPFGGVHETLIPHLTIAYADDGAVLDQAEHEIGPHLPLISPVTDVWVMSHQEPTGWRLRDRISPG